AIFSVIRILMPQFPLYIWPCGSGVTCYTESYHNVIPAFVQAVAAQGAKKKPAAGFAAGRDRIR
ncbi:MAG: hypothetical protein PHG76_11370, partial [Eubacteriales bacterium]|nr:hypothetical protein [Eubacteriales bacterium]